MDTEILKISQISRAAQLLRKGELVAFPTETVYGLGASLFDQAAIEKIYKAKGRPQDNPLIAHIADLSFVQEIAIDIPEAFYHLAERFFPGPLTLIIKRSAKVPAIASAGLDTIAIRQPLNPIANELIRAVGHPLVAPSANRSGKPSSTTAGHVLHDLGGKIAAVIDAGPCSIGIESTVLDLVSFERPTLLRPGSITKDDLEKILGREIDYYTHGPQTSPGMRYRHYAPDAPVKLFFSQSELENHLTTTPRCKRMLLSQKTLLGGVDHFVLLAQTLYANLRQADDEHYDEVLLLCDEQMQQDAGLMNRIARIVE